MGCMGNCYKHSLHNKILFCTFAESDLIFSSLLLNSMLSGNNRTAN